MLLKIMKVLKGYVGGIEGSEDIVEGWEISEGNVQGYGSWFGRCTVEDDLRSGGECFE